MTISPLFKAVRRTTLGLCVAFALVTLASTVRADDPPKIADPDAAAFVKKMSDDINELLKAVEAKDDAKAKAINAKMEETSKEGAAAVDSKMTPDEKTAMGTWMQAEMQKLMAAGWKPE